MIFYERNQILTGNPSYVQIYHNQFGILIWFYCWW
ncbi:hypothetical protein NC653_027796 [Populus alba x Populus x berolinensis]|uniref:Uncharacterized protein n=1 Tax=Populus alba x Populus x berolinensis TaxID=444605 RepID=A0AAD6Q6L8_9ROSI|nr:hypothetical protein NC653_027796 [Populus alba x Populus x berolinensis]